MCLSSFRVFAGVGIHGIPSPRRNARPGRRGQLLRRRLQHVARQLRSRLHADLAKDLVQVILDSARRDEQLGCNLVVGRALGDQLRDLRLLWRQLVAGLNRARASVLAGRTQLDACSLREAFHTEVAKETVRDAQLLARVDVATNAPQPLAVHQMSYERGRGAKQ